MRVKFLLTISLMVGMSPVVNGQVRIEEPPINYSDTKDANAVTELMEKIKLGEVKLQYDDTSGYLRSVLKELGIPESSQALVFSKTSMQVRYISPRNPRAIYFNDDVYVGWVRGSSLMEISTHDAKLGAAFYTVNMTPRNAYIRRANYDCLACHSTTMTQGVPGHTVRSVQPMVDGTIESQKQSFVTDHKSPFSQRWGGWYVTGRSGDMSHMGNSVLRGGKLEPKGDREKLNLRDDFDTRDWISPYSDVVALMVLEHQTQMHNEFTRANFTVRRAIHEHNEAYGGGDSGAAQEVPEAATGELDAIIGLAAVDVVDYLLMVDEFTLTSPVSGSVEFATDFVERGPADSAGRSLRDFNLKSRLFEHPCSYLIYSDAFESLEEPLREHIYKRLWQVLHDPKSDRRYRHLDSATRQAILEILIDTKSNLPSYWVMPTVAKLGGKALP